MKTRHVCMFSGGASSALMANWLLSQEMSPTLLFTNTLWEDEDCYRFIADCLAHFRAKYGHDSFQFVELTRGVNPLELFEKEGILGSNRVPLCSRILKSDETAKWVKEQVAQGVQPILHFGITLLEAHRADRIKARYAESGIECQFPLLSTLPTEPAHKIIETWGIKPPRMYELGFKHANCGGRCVRGKAKHWLHLLRTWPERYAEARVPEAMKQIASSLAN